MGLTAGPVPPRVDASVKAGMLDLIDHACEHGWSVRAACAAIGLDHLRAARWASRRSQDLILGGSPRASITLLLAAKSYTALQGRTYVTPDDIKHVLAPTYRHRIILRPEAEIEGLDADGVIRRFESGVAVPR